MFLRAWRGLARFEERAQFSTWLYRIAFNEAQRRLSRRAPPPVQLTPDRDYLVDSLPEAPHLGPEARARLTAARDGELLDKRIDVDLSVAGLTPALHLPMLAGLAQGPGFPNLSCLGLLSDRVLRRYVPVPPAASAPSAASTLERSERV